MRLALDAMGGDNAPVVTVEGAVLAAREYRHEIILVGQEDVIRQELSKYDTKGLPISIVNATETITMDDQPAQAVRQKKDSSMAVAAQLVKDKKADAFISAGNSGAAMTASLLYFGRITGVSRPALATVLPTYDSLMLLIDVGANVDCKPKHLLQFAIMGDIYTREVLGVAKPRIGLLSYGTEDSKGNEVSLATFAMLKNCDLNFIGNIEGCDIPEGKADVVVCDGFVGNAILKFGEGVSEMILKLVKKEFKAHPMAWASLPFLWSALKDLRKKIDSDEYGGAPLLGVDGICIIGHGSSNAKAIKSAIRIAARSVERNVSGIISEQISKYDTLEA
jgi:glycerol-3-phosphate acyltransferase PlsX